MALGLFAGASAEATSRQLLELRRQRLAEEQAQRQYELQQRQLQLQEQQLEWEKESQRLYEQFQLGVIDRQERERFALKTIELMRETADPQRRLIMWQSLDRMGSPYAGLAEGLLSDSLVDDPQQAFAYLQSLANAEPGQGFDVNVTRVYAKSAADFMGLSGQEADDFVQSYVDLANDLNANKETVDQAKLDMARLGVQNLAAEIEQKQTQTARLRQEMDHADQRLAMELEMFPIVRDQALAMRDIYRAEAVQAELIAGNMPYQIQLQNRLMWEQIRGEENRNKLFEATFDYQVSIMESEMNIKKEEARHLLATSHIRDALVQGDLDRVQATVDLLKAQTATEQAQAAHLGVQTEATRIANRNALIGSVLELVRTGGGAMVEQFAPQLLEGLVPPDLLPSLVDDLKRIADLRLDADLKAVEASTRIALVEADVAEQTAPFAVQQAQAQAQEATQRARIAGAQADVAEATVGDEIASRQAQADLLTMQAATYMEDRERAWQVQQHNMLMDERRTAAYVAQAQASAAARGAPEVVSRNDILESAEKGSGYKLSKLGEQRMELAELERDIAMLQTAIANNDGQTIMGIQNRYSLIGGDPVSLLAGLETEYETKSQMIINGYQAIIDWGLMYGHEFTPQELGLRDDDPMFWSAVERYPFFRARNQAVSENLDAVNHDVDMTIDDAVKAMTADAFMFADSVDVNGVTMAGSRATYDKLVDEHGAEALAAIGINGPEDLWARFQQRQAEYETHAQSLAILGNRFGVDISSRVGRDQLRQGLQTLSETLDMVEDRLMAAAQNPAGASISEQRAIYDQLGSLLNAYDGRIPGDIFNPFTGELNYQAALQAVRGRKAAIQQDIATIWYINARH